MAIATGEFGAAFVTDSLSRRICFCSSLFRSELRPDSACVLAAMNAITRPSNASMIITENPLFREGAVELIDARIFIWLKELAPQ